MLHGLAMGTAGGGAVVVADVAIAQTGIPDANLVLNLLMLIVLLFGAPRYFRAKTSEARAAEKDGVIQTHEQTINALRERNQITDEQVRTQDDRLNAARLELGTLRARYEEQSKYTAREALSLVEAKLTAIEELLRAWITKDAAESALGKK